MDWLRGRGESRSVIAELDRTVLYRYLQKSRERLRNGRTSLHSLVSLLRQRVKQESDAAKQLGRVAAIDVGHADADPESLQDALQQLPADASNRAAQHRELVENMENHVIPPLEQAILDADQAIRSTDCRSAIYQCTNTGKACRQAYTKYTKAHRDLVDAGAMLGRRVPAPWRPPADTNWGRRLRGMVGLPPTSPVASPPSTPSGQGTDSLRHRSSAAASGSSSNATGDDSSSTRRLLGGLRSLFAAPKDEETEGRQRFDATVQAEATARDDCIAAWQAYEPARDAFLVEVYEALESLDRTEKARQLTMSRALRSMVVFEASMYANLQYDAQQRGRITERAEDVVSASVPSLLDEALQLTAKREKEAAAARVAEAEGGEEGAGGRAGDGGGAAAPMEKEAPPRLVVRPAGPIELFVELLFRDGKELPANRSRDAEDATSVRTPPSSSLSVCSTRDVSPGALVHVPFDRVVYDSAHLRPVLDWLDRQAEEGQGGDDSGLGTDLLWIEAAPSTHGDQLPEGIRYLATLVSGLIRGTESPEWFMPARDEVEEDEVAGDDRAAARACSDSLEGPERLVGALDARRAEGVVLSSKAMRYLVDLMWQALDRVYAKESFTLARSLMVITQTFVAEQEPGEHGSSNGRETLQGLVKAHPLWRASSYWEAVVFETLGSEMNKVQQETDSDRKRHESDVTVRQLAFFAFNMLDFGMPRASVDALLEKYTNFIGLSSNDYDVISRMVDNWEVELEPSRLPNAAAGGATCGGSSEGGDSENGANALSGEHDGVGMEVAHEAGSHGEEGDE